MPNNLESKGKDDLKAWVVWKEWQDRREAERRLDRRKETFLIRWGWLVLAGLAAGFYWVIRQGVLL